MADKRISQLVERVTLLNNDVFPIVASGATTTNKVTLQTIDDYMQTNLDFGVTSVAMTVPTGLSVTGTPITSTGTFVVTFTAGYSIPTNAKQTQWDTAYSNRIVSVTAPITFASNVLGITQSGAASDGYLSSTDWNTFNNKQGALTFGNLTEATSSVLTITGGTGAVIGSGTSIEVKQASGTQDGFLDSADWTTFNGKQNALTGTGIVKSTGGTITYLTDNTSNWDSAYNDKINSAAVTGTTTKTLTLTQQDGGTITTTWTDLDTGTVTSVGVSMPSAFSVANSPITSSGTIAITGAGTISQYIDGTGALQTFPSGLPPTGAAGGDLTGTYPNPTVHRIHGIDFQNGTPTADDVWVYGGSPAKWQHQKLHSNQVTEDGNLFYTDARARASISESVTGLDYNSTTGVFSTSAGYGIPTTASQTNWDAAYNDKINSAAVTGTTTKTLTLTQQDGGTITASWTDINTDAVTSVFGRTGAVVATNGDYNTDQVTEGASNLYFTNARSRSSITLTTTGTSGAATYNSTTGVLNIPSYVGGVTSVNTLTGAVVLTTSNIAEGTNLYYTNARARGAISLTTTGTSGAATYDSATGVLNVPNYAPDLSGYVPTSRTLTINGTTFDLTANRTWTITAGVTGSGTENNLPRWGSGGTSLINSAVTDNGTTIVLGRSTSTLATATEANAITITAPAYSTDKPVKLLNFHWYDDTWSLGNIRSGTSTSNGLGVFLIDAEKVRFTSGALVLQQGVNLQFKDNPSIRWSSNFINLKNTDSSIPVIALRANGNNTQAPRLDMYNSADDSVTISLNSASGTGSFNVSLTTEDFRSTANGYISYGVDNNATRTLTIRRAGTTVLGFDADMNASFYGNVTGAKGKFNDVFVGGTLTGTYAPYADSVVGLGNLHLCAQGTGAIYINSALARPVYINPVGGNVGIGYTGGVSKLEVYSTLVSSSFTGITVTNSSGGGAEQSRAGIAFKAYDWVQSAIWHGRNISGNLGGALVFGTNPNTTDLTVGGVVGRMYLNNEGYLSIGHHVAGKKLTISRDTEGAVGGIELKIIGGVTDGNYDGLYFTQASDGSTPLASFRCDYKSTGYPALSWWTRNAGLTESRKMTLTNGGNLLIGIDTDGGYRFRVSGGSSQFISGTSTIAQFMGDGGFDGSNRFYITNYAYVYGRTNLVLTGRLDANNDGYSFGSNCRNSIVFNINEGGAQGAIGTEYYSIQLHGVLKTLYIQSKYGQENGLNGFTFSEDNQLRIRNVNSYGNYALQVNGTIYATGDVIAYSDISVKTNIRPIENVLQRVANSRGVVYDRIDKDDKNNIGFIAQELEQQFPELVSTNVDGTKGVKYQNAVAILFEAIKEQQKQIEELKKQVV